MNKDTINEAQKTELPAGQSAVPCSAQPVTPGTLEVGEPHPMANDALKFVVNLGLLMLMQTRDAMSSCAIEGNRSAEVCGETIQRVLDRKPVSDRYILGTAWMLKSMGEETLVRMVKELVDAPKGVVPDSVYEYFPGFQF